MLSKSFKIGELLLVYLFLKKVFRLAAKILLDVVLKLLIDSIGNFVGRRSKLGFFGSVGSNFSRSILKLPELKLIDSQNISPKLLRSRSLLPLLNRIKSSANCLEVTEDLPEVSEELSLNR